MLSSSVALESPIRLACQDLPVWWTNFIPAWRSSRIRCKRQPSRPSDMTRPWDCSRSICRWTSSRTSEDRGDPRSGDFCPQCDCYARRAADSGGMPRASHSADHDQLRPAVRACNRERSTCCGTIRSGSVASLAKGRCVIRGLPVHLMILRWPDGPVAMPWPRSGRTVRDRRRARRSGPRRQCRPGGRTSRPGPCAARASPRSP